MATDTKSSKIDSSALKKTSNKNSGADANNKSTAAVSKAMKKTSSQSKANAKTATKTREKKVYSLPGQKYDVPEEREPLRIFYESLSKQIPSSEMAEFWLMEHGMLSPERAKEAFEKKQRKQKQLRAGNPDKLPSSSATSKAEDSNQLQQVSKNDEAKVQKRILNESDDDDDDFVLSHKRRKGASSICN